VNHEQALQTTPQLANTADSWHFGCPRKLRFILKLHVKGDRETALPMLMVVLKCCGVKNSSKEGALPMLSLVQEAQCGLNLSKVKTPSLIQSMFQTSIKKFCCVANWLG
jgi:hypothetical protein